MSAKKPLIEFEPPTFSWDVPIEQEILSFVRQMKAAWAGDKRGQQYYNAYETVEKHIVREVEFRKKIKNIRIENNEATD